jgi:hypothetical protein
MKKGEMVETRKIHGGNEIYDQKFDRKTRRKDTDLEVHGHVK